MLNASLHAIRGVALARLGEEFVVLLTFFPFKYPFQFSKSRPKFDMLLLLTVCKCLK